MDGRLVLINQSQLTNGEQSGFSAAFCSNPDEAILTGWNSIISEFNSVTNNYIHFILQVNKV
jgi:hypothetical protein